MKMFELGFGKTEQEISVSELSVNGVIPTWLEGTLIRNGPGTFHIGDQYYRHWFDGHSMLHKFSFRDGKVSYLNRFLETRAHKEAMDAGRIVYSEFATDPCRNLFGRARAVFSPQVTDDAKVNVTKIDHKYMALAETPIQVFFDPDTLKTVGVFNYEDRLVGQMTTVHPTFDFKNRIVYNNVVRYHAISHYNIYQMVGSTNPKRVASLPVREPAYLHSFGMSQNYVILTEFPLVVNPISLLLWIKPYIENFKWKPARGTSIYVVNRFTGELVGKYQSDPFFAFHHVNAFEKDGELIFDIVAYEDASILQAYYLENLKDKELELPFGKLRRYHLPLKGKRAEYEVISDVCMELPVFDYDNYVLRDDYRYVYAVSLNPEDRRGFYNQIVKVDIETGKDSTWYEKGCYPGEPIFVPRPDRDGEDDGVLLSVVLDERKGTSFLLVLDAQDLNEIGRAEIPHAVLFGYHGKFFNEPDYEQS